MAVYKEGGSPLPARNVQMRKGRSYRILLAAVGIIAVGLGTVGVFLPLLPTTPFLLLAAACFIRSSDRLYSWLIHHRWFGRYIRNYREHRAVTRRAKVVTLVALWSVIGYSALAVATTGWLRALLGVVAIGVTLHVLSLRTLTPGMLETRTAMGGKPSPAA